ncbi:MAG: hypothetical protein ACLFNP_03120 [Spirochaetaceae bacterium]
MRSNSKALLILLILYLLGVVFAFTTAAVTFPGELVHQSFTDRYILYETISTFFRHLFAFHGAGVLLAFSLFLSPGDLREGGSSLFRAARSTVIAVIILGLLYTLASVWFLPAAESAKAELQYRTTLAEELRADLRVYEESRQFRRAVGALESYKRLVGSTDELEMELQTLRSRASELELAETPREEEVERQILRSDLQELGPAELASLAREFFEEEDYYSAHYYASRAVELSDAPRTDAQRLAARAWEEITSYALTTGEESDSDYIRRKREAYEAFQAGDRSEESLIEAYYRLRDLREERPEDPDVERYLSLATEQLRRVSFFMEDAERARANAGAREIIGVNDRSAAELELFRIGKMVRAGESEYLYDIEVIRYDEGGEIRYHLTAPYGKLVGSTITMQAISADSPGSRVLPTYRVGTPEGELSFIYEISYSPEELATAARGVERRAEAHIGELLTLRALAERLALPAEPLELELFMRVGEPLLFIALSFLFLGIGWALRSHYVMRPPAMAMLLLPLLPVLAGVCFALARYVVKVVAASLILSLGTTTAAVVTATVLLLFLLVALYSVLRHSLS